MLYVVPRPIGGLIGVWTPMLWPIRGPTSGGATATAPAAVDESSTAGTVRQLRHHYDSSLPATSTLFWTISHVVISSIPPTARGVRCSSCAQAYLDANCHGAESLMLGSATATSALFSALPHAVPSFASPRPHPRALRSFSLSFPPLFPLFFRWCVCVLP